jgi:hypothetical protein
MGAHARKNASGCKRWSNCPGSLVLSEGRPNESSAAARLGTAAHGLGEHCLRSGRWPIDMVGGIVYLDEDEDAHVIPPDPDAGEEADAAAYEACELHEAFPIDANMADAVQVYVSAVREEMELRPDAELMVERRFDLSWVRPEMFGTGDATVFQLFEHMSVKDYKHGQGVVVEVAEEGNWIFHTFKGEAPVVADPTRQMRGNPQLMYYGLGLAKEVDWAFETLDLTIIQPRARHADGGVRTYSTSKAELLEYQEWLERASDEADRATAAVDRAGLRGGHHGQVAVFLHKEGFLHAGTHCQFCPNAGIPCPALMDEAYTQAKLDFVDGEPMLEVIDDGTPDDRLTQAMAAVPMLDIFCKAVNGEVLRRLQQSEDGTGFGHKLVRKRANRVFVEGAADMLVERGYPREALFHPPKMKGITDIESLRPAALIERLKEQKVKAPVGALKAIVAEVTDKPLGGITVAPMSDPRDAVAPTTLAAADFDAVGED